MISLTTADNALKNMYLGVVANQFNTNINPFLSKVERSTTSVVGKQIERLVTVSYSGGIGAGTEMGNLPASAENKYLTLKTGLKNLYGKIEFKRNCRVYTFRKFVRWICYIWLHR